VSSGSENEEANRGEIGNSIKTVKGNREKNEEFADGDGTTIKVRQTAELVKQRSFEGKKQINQYTIEKLIGKGAFGSVFKAIDDKGEAVAIKVYNKRVLKSRWIGKSRTALDLLNTEIQVMSVLNHPNIVKLREVIDKEDSKKIYLILEYAEQGSLFNMSPIEEATARPLFRALITAINYLHNEVFVVHRDIKPQNLLMTGKNELKICDFGAAQFMEAMRDELTNSAGTYIFMPPEAHRNKKFQGRPADIWACGITLYFLLSGQTPFKKRRFSAIIEEINELEIEFPEHFGEEVKDVIRKMTMKDPAERICAKELLEHPWLKGD
jgi:calcium/calmodulin-dependent protein kinase kinase 2